MKFLIQFDSDDTTRWRTTPAQLADTLRILGETAAKVNTSGAQPRVTVIREERTDYAAALQHVRD